MKAIFSEEQKQFLINNYPNKGSVYCSEILPFSPKQICSKAHKLGLLLLPEIKKKIQQLNGKNIKKNKIEKTFEEYHVNPIQFFKPQTREVAYILGILWADGYLLHKISYIISLQLVLSDLLDIKHIFDFAGKWCFYTRKRPNRKEQGTLTTTNKPLFNFLSQHNYIAKNNKSADSILQIIPDNLKLYWFRGLIDGDGCFYQSKNKMINQFSISSSYNQNWHFAENLFKYLDINYSIRRSQNKSKTNSSSMIRITGIQNIIKLGSFIYPNNEFDGIGFSRKYNKYICIKNKDRN